MTEKKLGPPSQRSLCSPSCLHVFSPVFLIKRVTISVFFYPDASSAGTFTISTVGDGRSLVAPMASNVFARTPMMGGAKNLCAYKRYAQ